MQYVYLGIFIVFTSIHLYASWKQDKTLRAFTKGFILLAVLGFYLESVDTYSWYVCIALLLSWLGDILLIPNGVKWFTAGGISFMASHIFFILAYSQYINFGAGNIFVTIAIAVVYAAIVTFLFSKLKKHLPKPLFYPMYVYLLINGTMNTFAWYRLLAGVNAGSIITAIGALGFFISDCTLFFVRFDKSKSAKGHFWVMLAYSVGEFLIALGLIL